MINSVCLCLTFKCDLACRHCFVSAGPERTEEMSNEQIATAIDNSYKNVNRMWFSGGEPTVVMDKLLFGLHYAKDKKRQYGFPDKICVQTNGNFAKTKEDAIKYLALFHKNGANEIDITSNDVFHFEQMDQNIPERLAKLANNMGIFENVSIGGSDYKVVKRFGRAKNIPLEELKGFDLKYTRKCVFTGTDYVIHPNGDVLPCIYGFNNVYGNIYKNTLLEIIGDKKNIEISSLLREDSILRINDISNQHNLKDICDSCNCYFEAYWQEENGNA